MPLNGIMVLYPDFSVGLIDSPLKTNANLIESSINIWLNFNFEFYLVQINEFIDQSMNQTLDKLVENLPIKVMDHGCPSGFLGEMVGISYLRRYSWLVQDIHPSP